MKGGSYHKRRIFYKGKSIRLQENPKVGVCSECKRSVASGEVKLTNIHHEEYDDLDIFKHTRELCPRCHLKRTIKLGQMGFLQ